MLVKYNKSNSKKVGTMKLKGFGHGESLEVAKNSKGVEYVYIAAQKYKDKNGKHPVVTLNYLSANPNFYKIKEKG